MRLVFMGTPEFAVPALRALAGAGHTIALVVTPPDRPRRNRASPPAPCAVKLEAGRLALPLLETASVRDAACVARLRDADPQTIVVVAFGQLLPPEILAIPPSWCINLHASMLPRYRGAAPIARAIMANEKITGCTTMKMDRGLDTGEILLQREAAVGLLETAGELGARLAGLGAELLVDTLRDHERGRLEPRRQDGREASVAPALTKEDGRIDWSDDAPAIAGRIRGCNPWPAARALLGGRLLQLLRAEVGLEPGPANDRRPAPGEVVRADGDRILVQCGGESRLSLLELRAAGGRTIDARAAINGRIVRAGDRFEPDGA